MYSRKICGYVFFAGLLLIWFVKLFLRPYFPPSPGTAACFLMGGAPNMIGSLLVPFTAQYFFGNGKGGLLGYLNIYNADSLGFVCLLGYFLGVINEFLQLWPLFGRTFDWLDLLFSAVGALGSFAICRAAMTRHARDYHAA